MVALSAKVDRVLSTLRLESGGAVKAYVRFALRGSEIILRGVSHEPNAFAPSVRPRWPGCSPVFRVRRCQGGTGMPAGAPLARCSSRRSEFSSGGRAY